MAIELFAAVGYHATSVAEIGSRTDLQPGALYYHIKSKEELLWEILRRYTEKALEGARRVASTDADPVDKLGQLIDVHVAIILRHRSEVLIQIRDADALSSEHAARLQALRQGVQDCWETVLEEGYRAGKFTRSNRIVVNSLLGMVNSISQWYRPRSGSNAEEIARELRATIIDGLAR
ncbi:TetR/AcrR family transcriptional regulator [Nocardia asteroides]|uniref:TetR/AcrR family transcriptional regulator n=1 Tax=Nocardia asteroides TaxID=1824 RepID=UPI001E592358|nr:TetR/AcrR family transcriptional regulator [Nocardia asteroides]UGT55107.1 TetR/AcrR family transcriptional regulator [Nocardia asteroides]